MIHCWGRPRKNGKCQNDATRFFVSLVPNSPSRASCDSCADRLGLTDASAFREVSVEEWGAAEMAQIESAIGTVDKLLNDKQVWEDAQVAGLELSDAIDDLNDSLLDCEEVMRQRRIRPGWVPMTGRKRGRETSQSCALVWDGGILLFDDGERALPLLKASKEIRLHAANYLTTLRDELLRPR